MSSARPLRLAVQSPSAEATELAALRPAVRGLVARILGRGGHHPDVEDAENEAMRRALEGRSRLRPGEPLRPWVFGIARHVALDALRARRKEGGEAGLEALADPAPLPDAALEHAERAHRVGGALARLEDDQRTALLMFHVEDRGYREIAEHLGVPIGTVGTWIARGRRRLAEELGKGETR